MTPQQEQTHQVPRTSLLNTFSKKGIRAFGEMADFRTGARKIQDDAKK